MIDFIKIVLRNNYSEILSSNPLLTFFDNANRDTGEVRTKNKNGKEITPHRKAFYKGLEFRIYDNGLVIIMGSLHKYWNNGEHNYNDFDLKDVKTVLMDFTGTFKINPKDTIINQLEVGLNIIPPYRITKILQNIFLHKTTPLVRGYTKTEGNYYQAEHQQYWIKIYDKSLQYKNHFNIDSELLRFEIKYKREKIKKLGIHSVEDLLITPFEIFNNELIKEFNSLLIYDFTIKHKTIKLMNYSNPNYWINYIINKQQSTFYKHKNMLKDLIENHSQNIKEQLLNIINIKARELTFDGATINSMCIGLIPTPPIERKCKITGLGITMQRSDSFLLSHTGLKYYKKFNYNVFREIERRYLSNYWDNVSDKVKIKEIAHNIRNKWYSKRVDCNQLRIAI